MSEKLDPKVVLEICPTDKNPRNSEGDFIELRDGRLLFAYSKFYGNASDAGSAYIAGRYSHDRGYSWGEDHCLVENEGDKNVMSVSFLRFKTGEIGLFYLVKNSDEDCKLYMRKSYDEAKTFSKRVCCMNQDNYFVVNNDRVVQLSNGRILAPAAYCIEGRRANFKYFYSDDAGETWLGSNTVELVDYPDNLRGLQEPGIIELDPDTLMMWARTTVGSQCISFSTDRGKTWSNPQPSDLKSPLSPASIKRIPVTGDLLCVYNDHSSRYAYNAGNRTPLVTAISTDQGQTWKYHNRIEDDLAGWFDYIAIAFVDNAVLLGYCAGDSINKLGKHGRLRIKRINISDLYV